MGTQIFPNWAMDVFTLWDQDRHEVGGYVAINLYGRRSKLKVGAKGYLTYENKSYNPEDPWSEKLSYVDFKVIHVYSPLSAKIKFFYEGFDKPNVNPVVEDNLRELGLA